MTFFRTQVALGALLVALTRMGTCGDLTATKVASLDTAQLAFAIALSPDGRFVAAIPLGGNSSKRRFRFLRHRDKWQLRPIQARISLESNESYDEAIPPQSFWGI